MLFSQQEWIHFADWFLQSEFVFLFLVLFAFQIVCGQYNLKKKMFPNYLIEVLKLLSLTCLLCEMV